jgi:Divergent InlB B-repeat domain
MRFGTLGMTACLLACGTSQMPQANVIVIATGPGGVASSPAGLACRTQSCSQKFDSGAFVALSAHPDANASFGGWTGVCTGFALSCEITVGNKDVTANATFFGATSAGTHVVTVNVTGAGSVISSPPGINCPTQCTASFPDASPVMLTETASNGATFQGWTGCTGSDSCTFTLSQDLTVGAPFSTPANTFTVTVAVTGNGSVTSNPTGINCPAAACTASFGAGANVKLSPVPTTANDAFSGWTGGCSGTDNCILNGLSSNVSATAAFNTPGY